MADVILNLTVITLYVNGINILIKSQTRRMDKKTIQLYAVCKIHPLDSNTEIG